MQSLREFYRSFGEEEQPPQSPNGGIPKYVKFAPGDRGVGLPPAFFEDPRTFKPKPGVKGQVHAWGIYPYDDEFNLPEYDGIAGMYRQMNFQMTYMRSRGSPEDQFIEVLMDRKRKQLAAMDLAGRDKQDVILNVKVLLVVNKDGEHRIWRKFRVSAGMKLSVFQDKVLSPIMGWVRNFHCYTFTDYRDGALFGPQSSGSIDRVHVAQVGYDYLPDEKYSLAHLFEKEGDSFGYLYDFGDKWNHEIIVEKIFPPEESYGRVEILDGKGMCPGENLNGSFRYNEYLQEYDAMSPQEKVERKREILSSPNYDAFGKPPSLFDPDAFDLAAATGRLTDALGSTNSVRWGAKKYNLFENPMAADFKARDLQKGQHYMHEHDKEGGFWEETLTERKDKKNETVCAECGSPDSTALKVCGGCRQIMYCSPEHQKAHWKTVHKKQCNRKFLKN